MTPSPPAAPAWADAKLAAALLAIDSAALGGAVVRAGPGQARDRWLAHLRAGLAPDAPWRRIPAHIDDDRLLGGLDLAATLAAGQPVVQRGVLAQSDRGVVILSMAERTEAGAAARLASVLDHGEVVMERDGLALRAPARIALIALDEGLGPEERPPDALLERLAFHLDLNAIDSREAADDVDRCAVEGARRRLADVGPAEPAIIEAVCAAAAAFGVGSARAPILTLRAARAHAALAGRTEMTAEDAVAAARLVLAPRATALPEEAAPSPEDESAPPPENRDLDTSDDEPQAGDETERLVAAVGAALPEDLLARLKADGGRGARPRGRGAGAPAASALRGRPAGSRAGALRPGARLSLVDTLRAAAPWQRLRAAGSGAARVRVRRSDLRVRRYVRRRRSTTIFVVDASGSTAAQRLGEAKGAVELLLARAYVSRARVALIGFRGAGAELLLAPTRSLARAKKQLADLPGGGGTPLAAGIEAALSLALAERARDNTPMLVFLTDGQANIARDGAAGRAAAETDALAIARQVLEAGVASVFVDTAPRARPDADRFARAMGAVYAPLPYANADGVAGVVRDLQTARA